jgi:hypothetical protein
VRVLNGSDAPVPSTVTRSTRLTGSPRTVTASYGRIRQNRKMRSSRRVDGP